MKKHYALLQRGTGMRNFIGKLGLVIAAILPSVRALSQAPIVVVTTPGACTTGNLTATSTIQPLSIAWTGPSSGTTNATWVASATTVAGLSQGTGLNQLNNPNGLFLDATGNLYVADFNNNRVIKFTPPFNPSNNGTIVAGTGTAGSANTQLNGPTAVFVDGSGNVFVCDQGNNRVMEWSPPYSSGTCVAGGNGFASGNTALAAPFGLYMDGSGNLFVGDKSNNRVQKFTAAQIASATAGQTSASVAGTTVLGGNSAGIGATQLNFPSGVFIDASGNLYVADYNNHRIQRITAAQIAGATAGQTSSSAAATTPAGGNGAGTAANQLNHPNSVFLDCANNIYIADYSNNRVQQWLSGAGSGTTVAGSSSGTAGSTSSLLNLPSDAVVDGSGNLFVTDYNNSRVQEFTPTIVNTFAYTLPGTYTATVTTFTCATGSGNATTTTAPAITGQPSSTTVCAGSSASFTVTASATGIAYQWFENGVSLGAGGTIGGVTYSGTTTATLTINPTTAALNGNTYSVVVSGTCNLVGITSSSATLTVNSPASIVGSPPTTQTTCVGSNTSISVFATGTNLTYTWQVNPPAGFALASGANYSGATTTTLAISNTPAGFNGNQYRVIVNSTVCPGAVTSSVTTLTVNPLPVINAPQPQPVTVCNGGNATYVVSASGNALSYQWQYSTTGSGGPWTNQLNITPFTGANTPTLFLTGVTTAMNGYYYQCVVTSGVGCVATTIPALLTVNPVPTVTLGSINAICAGVTTAILPYSGLTGGSSFTYTISGGSFGNGTGAITTIPSGNINIPVPGSTTANTYNANFLVTNSVGCSSTSQPISIVVNALPTVTFVSTSLSQCFNASNNNLNLQYSNVSGQSPYTYSLTWSGGPASVPTAALTAAPPTQSIVVPVPGGTTAGTYTGIFTVTDGNNCSSNPTSTITLTVNPLPTITFTNGGNASECAGNTTGSLGFSATTASQYSIAWNGAPGNGFSNVATTSMPGLSPINFPVPGLGTPGTYTGTLTLTSAAGCTNTFNITDTINANPTVSLGANPAVCYGTTSTSISYTTTNNPLNYSITWSGTAQAAGFTGSGVILPLSGASGSISISVPGTGNPGTYTGTLFVYTASGCQNGTGTSFNVTINAIPSIIPTTIAPGINASVCAGSTPAVLNYNTPSGSPDQYSITAWGSTSVGFATVNNQTLGAAINIAIPLAASAGFDTATLTVRNSTTGCISPTMQIVVQVNALPTISLGAIPAVCQGAVSDTLNYSATTGSPITYSITWSSTFTPVTNQALPADPIPITVPGAAAAGTYNGSLTVNNGTCTSLQNIFHVVINPTPTITMTSPQSICSLQTTILYPYTTTGEGTSATDSIVWDPINAVPQGFINSTGTLPVLPSGSLSIAIPTNPVPNIYNGTMYTTSQFGCTSTGSAFSVNVLNLPTVSLGTVNPLCFSASGQTALLPYTTTGSATTYNITWSGAPFVPVSGSLSGSAGSISLAVPAGAPAGTYTGTLTVSNANCTSLSSTFTITINPLPALILGANQAVCYNASTAQTASYTYSSLSGTGPWTYSITWSPAGPATAVNQPLPTPAPGPIVINIPAGTGSASVVTTYSGTLTITDANGCTSSQTVFSLVINPLPTITLGANPNVCTGATSANLTYTATTNGGASILDSVKWSGASQGVGFTNFSGTIASAPPASSIPITVPGAAAAGSYNGTLTVTNSTTGCTSNNYSFNVILSQKPVKPIISPNPDTVCAGNTISLCGLTSSPGTPNITYTWVTPISTFIPPTTAPNIQTGAAHTKSTGVNDCVNFFPILADVTESGVYKLTAAIVYNGGALTCVSDTATDSVYIIPAPPAPSPSSNSPLCVGATLYLYSGITLGPGQSLTWNGPSAFSATFTSGSGNDSITNVNLNNTGDYLAFTSITVGTYTCFSSVPSTHVEVRPLPPNPTTSIDVPNHSITVCEHSLLFIGGFSANGVNGQPNFVWNPTPLCFGTGFPQFVQNINIPNTLLCDSGMYVLNTAYPYFVQGHNFTCYSAIPDTVYVHVNALPPTPGIATVNSPVCLGDTIHFHASNNPALCPTCYAWTDSIPTQPGPGGLAFVGGPGIGADVYVANATVQDSGWYVVHSTSILNNVTCQSAVDLAVKVRVKPLPVIPNIVPLSPSYCEGDTIRLSAVDTQHNVTYIWRPINPDSCWHCNGTIPGYPAGTSGVNNLDTITTQTLQINYALAIDSGIYQVYAVLNGCKSSLPASTPVIIKPRPNNPGDSSNGPICAGTVLHLYAYDTVSNPPNPPTLTTVNYSWTGPGGFTSFVPNPSIVPTPLADSGDYCVTASLNGCSAFLPACTHVSVRPIPANPLASNNAPVCSGAPNQLILCATSTTPGVTYAWTGPINLTPYNPNQQCVTIPAPTTAMSGTYSVFSVLTYYFIKNGNNDTLSCNSAVPGVTTVTVNTTPPPPLTANVNYCQYDPTTQLTAVGTNLLWYTTATGGVGNTVAPTPFDSLAGTTIWYVSQTSVNGCTSARASLSVTVTQQSQPPLVPNPTITYCQGDASSMLNVVGVALRWYTSSTGGIPNFITPIPSTATPGTTVWYVTQTTNGCESPRVPVTVIVKQRPQPPVVSDVTYCQNETAVPLTAIGQNLLWYTTPTGGFGASTGPTPITTTPDTIIYYVTESFNGCESYRVKQHVFVLYTPNAVIVASKPYVCQDSVISFKYFGSALPDASYDWGLPSGSHWDSGRGPGPIYVKFDSSGQHVITLIVSNGRCVSPLTSYIVNVRPMPVQTIGSLHEVCEGDVMIVGLGYATPGVSQYIWNFDSTGAYVGNGIYDTGAAIISSAGPEGPFSIKWTIPGLHVIKVSAVLNSCPSGWTTDTINVHPLPDARISTAGIGIPCTNDSVQFSAVITSEENLYTWSPEIFFVNGNSSASVYGNVHYSSYVNLQVTTPYGCIAKDSLFVQTDSCCKVGFPNAFTPDGANGYPDGLNDYFRPFIKEKGHHVLKVFRIANRWGQTVFETTDETHGWDGKFNGVKQEMDTYFWYIDYICSYNNVRYRERGELYLIR